SPVQSTTGLSAEYETTEGFRDNDDEDNYRLGIQLGYKSLSENNAKPTTLIKFTSDYLDETSGSPGYVDSPTLFYRKKNTLSITAVSVQYLNIHSISSLTKSDTQNTDVTRDLDKNLSITEFEHTISSAFNSQYIGNYGLGISYYNGRASGSDFSSQMEYTWSSFSTFSMPSDWLFVDVSAGLRLNYSSAFDYSLNPEINISYPNEKWGLSFSYSGSNNNPSFKKRFNQTSSTIPNPSLGMETADNFSLTLTNKVGSDFSSSINLYYNILTDRITYVRENGIGQYQNLGKVTYTGFNISNSWRATDKLAIKLDYSYLEAIDQESSYWLTSKSRHTSNLIFQYRPSEFLSINLKGKHRSKSYTNKANTLFQEPYTLVNIQIEYTVNNIRLFANVDNMFDEYYTFAGGLPSPSRYWELGIQYSF
ncbi:MAG: TonB-dependent receptor, partial [Paraglaciecola sp.]|nr:TonB-dependent receptor [Paraglaciecola sp.]